MDKILEISPSANVDVLMRTSLKTVMSIIKVVRPAQQKFIYLVKDRNGTF